jgi:hypothetical protein
VVVGFGLIFGFDATRQDVVEDLMGVEPGETDSISARELVDRSDQQDRNFVAER